MKNKDTTTIIVYKPQHDGIVMAIFNPSEKSEAYLLYRRYNDNDKLHNALYEEESIDVFPTVKARAIWNGFIRNGWSENKNDV